MLLDRLAEIYDIHVQYSVMIIVDYSIHTYSASPAMTIRSVVLCVYVVISPLSSPSPAEFTATTLILL